MAACVYFFLGRPGFLGWALRINTSECRTMRRGPMYLVILIFPAFMS
jgi:hypothetical protein